MKIRKSGILIIQLLGILLSFVALDSNVSGAVDKRIPVKWWDTIYAPSFGLDDDRVVIHQERFLDLHSKWSGSLRFRVYINESKKSTVLDFQNCGQVHVFLKKEENVVWETDLDRFRFWIQASNCNVWKLMPGLHNSEASYLPDLEAEPDNNTVSVKFVNELAKVLAENDFRTQGDFLRGFNFSKDREIDCSSPSECSYDLPDDYNETYLFRIVAQGDYDNDKINDVFVSVFAPKKKSGYAGVIVTRRTSESPIKIVAEY